MKPTVGVCYYPEHWPEDIWHEDARRMVEAGIEWVRIGEFAWSRMEATPGVWTLDWLDRAIDVLGRAGLKVIMGTPTATPPRWMIDKHPDMLAVDANGNARKFGSRRHYCFSHMGYREECARVVELLGVRYSKNPFVAAWQTDNEYGCHDTTLSYSDAAQTRFREWLAVRYGSVDVLNDAWGNIFWSMGYNSFDQIELPNLTVTEPNPAHVLAFRRFASDEVAAFNRVQTEILRKHTDTPLIHNYMGRELGFDHFDVGADLDVASWDSYPIGFLSDRLDASEAQKSAYLRQGDPDNQAFHHDLYRAVGRGRWWVMEQQPGPVNWAPYNPAPLPGMVALWGLEAIAHGAEVVSYFRWRQAPFGQEQYHAGLLYADDRDAPGLAEAQKVAEIARGLDIDADARAPIALVFDYPSAWAWHTQPQGADFDYFHLTFATYKALRRAGFSVDIVPASAQDLSGYKLAMAPGLATIPEALIQGAKDAGTLMVLGPRTGAITEEYSLPPRGRPDVEGLDVYVDRVESLPPGQTEAVAGGGAVCHWLEELSGGADALLKLETGASVLVGDQQAWYLGGVPDENLWDRVIGMAAGHVGLTVRPVPVGARRREVGDLEFLVNYSDHSVEIEGETVAGCGVTILRGGVCIART
ncbi:beta-galactosidase [Shimia abyssi]|uniref:Beta-galactosidase n=1 Tax=Shimia abyssi TaxID=1662395 RepID=A0A2P8FAS3_9RHOB|nr:beta-galactosidase [Shimia abyssi]PSL18830.1 beta-galactosidase [Shimia abyssi]